MNTMRRDFVIKLTVDRDIDRTLQFNRSLFDKSYEHDDE